MPLVGEIKFRRRGWLVPDGKRTHLDTWFSQAHDLIAFAPSRGSAILLAESRYRLVSNANGPGYDD